MDYFIKVNTLKESHFAQQFLFDKFPNKVWFRTRDRNLKDYTKTYITAYTQGFGQESELEIKGKLIFKFVLNNKINRKLYTNIEETYRNYLLVRANEDN